MDQTIVIGDIEDGNLFEDLKDSNYDDKQEQEDGDIPTITSNELQQVIQDLKIKHRAELDAISLEQVTYKRII